MGSRHSFRKRGRDPTLGIQEYISLQVFQHQSRPTIAVTPRPWRSLEDGKTFRLDLKRFVHLIISCRRRCSHDDILINGVANFMPVL